MNWRHPFRMPANTPTITSMAPGAMLEKSIEEIQKNALVEILPSGTLGSEGTEAEVEITVERAGQNAVRLAGKVMVPEVDPSTVLPEPSTENYVLTVVEGEWVCGPVRAI